MNRLQNLGATITRSHYPLHPAFLEAFDRAGIMYWVDAPVYQVPTDKWAKPGVRTLAKRAADAHGEEQPQPPVGPHLVARERAIRGGVRTSAPTAPGSSASSARPRQAVRELDDTRLVGLDRQSRVGEPLTTEAHRYLDVLGVNEYFGWYRSVIENRPTCPRRPPPT